MPKIVVDGVTHEVEPDRNLLEACLDLGYDLPFFCWHPAMGSVGACRQCAVKIGGRIVMACMTAADEGVALSIADPEVVDFRRSVIEWLMRNHPHDCPVCDEGGECHLQDMTVMTGHVYRRDRFPKRTYRNQDLGPFVDHEMNRCIQCYRCVRFYEKAGGTDLTVLGCHDAVFFGRREDGVLESPFSGNLVEVCPTGVFTDKTHARHYTRKWDLTQAPSVCPHCALGCNTTPGERYGMLRRIRNRHNAEVNGWFLCDRGRFGYEFVNRADRLRAPRDRAGPIPVEEARRRLAALGPDTIGIGSPRASLEANLALRERVGPERFYAGVPARELALLRAAVDLLRAVPAASIRDAEQADAVLVLGEDVLTTAPRLALALREAARNAPRARAMARLGVPAWHDQAIRDAIGREVGPVFVITPGPTALDEVASAIRRAAPDEIVRVALEVAERKGPVAEALRAAKRPVVVTGISIGSRALLEAAAAAARALGARLAIVLPECDSAGLALLAERSLDDAMASGARSAIVLENDLFRRAPAAPLERWLASLSELVVLDALETATVARASLALPTGTFAESSGTFVSSEGRAQRFFRVFPLDEAAPDAWRWLQPGWQRLDDALDAIAQVPAIAPAAGAAPRAGWRARDGERVPRQTPRFTGRTAMHADRTMHEPKPPDDPDSPLAFSMEGAALSPPHPLRTFQWLPGWSSGMSLARERSASARGGSGVRLLEPDGREVPTPAVPAERPVDGRVLVLEAHLVHGTEELSARAEAVATQIPPAFLEMAPEDAPGAEVEIRIDDVVLRLPVRPVPGLCRGIVRLPRGLPGLEPAWGLALPAWGRIGSAS